MKKYWFATQDPKVPVSGRNGLWISNHFINFPRPSINVGDRVGIYEPKSGKTNRHNGAKAVVALASITKLENPWKQEDDGFWRIAQVEITESDEKGIPLRTVLKILTDEDISSGIKRGVTLRNLYAGRVTKIGYNKFKLISQYFSAQESEEEYQRKVENEAPTKPPERPQKPKWREINGRTVLSTDPGIGKYCLSKAGFTCEVNSEHTTFKSKVTGRNYVEAHHLIPLKSQIDFKRTLDNEANIVSLCPNCHRLLHHAPDSEKRTHLKALLNDTRKQALKNRGTPITFRELLKYY